MKSTIQQNTKNTVRVCDVDIPSLMLDYAMKVER